MINNNKIIDNDIKEMSMMLDYSRLKGKSILITGATGMLASYLTNFLDYLNKEKSLNLKIIILVRNLEKARKKFSTIDLSKDVEVLNQDICDPIRLEGKLDFIFHMAGSADPYSIKNNPVGIIQANTIGSLNVCHLAKEKNAEVLFTSTREVYGKMPENIQRIREEDMGVSSCIEERSSYPESKRMAETIITSYSLQFGIKYKIFRIAHSYGPGMNLLEDGRVMSDFISNVVNNKNIILKSKGEDLRAFCYISDTITAIFYALLYQNENNVYNISNEEEELSIKELAELLIKIFPEKKLEICQTENFSSGSYTNYKRTGLDTQKIRELGWQPKVKLLEGLKRTVDSFMEDRINEDC